MDAPGTSVPMGFYIFTSYKIFHFYNAVLIVDCLNAKGVIMGIFGKEIPNYYAMSLDELADLYTAERARNQKLLKKKLEKTKKQADNIKKARKVTKATANGCKEGGIIHRLIAGFGKKEETE